MEWEEHRDKLIKTLRLYAICRYYQIQIFFTRKNNYKRIERIDAKARKIEAELDNLLKDEF